MSVKTGNSMLRQAVTLTLFALALRAVAGEAQISEEVRNRIEKDRPSNVVITSINANETPISIQGTSVNVNAIANFVENIKADTLFTLPEVKFIREKPGALPKTYEFEFSFSLRAK
jgi:Tfp pilus assembly protein PilN